MAKKTTPDKAPTRATLNGEQFNTLVRLTQAVVLKQIEFQRALDELMHKRNAYYAQIAQQYHLPATFQTMRWDDDTLQVEVT